MANSLFTIEQALAWAKQQLITHKVSDDGLHDSAAVDSKVLLSASLNKEIVYLHTWPDKSLSAAQMLVFQDYIAQRVLGRPVAHIVGYRDFWSLRLNVSPVTLIPRPETELLVELVLGLDLPKKSKVLDLGTGTGAIALALASEKPDWLITGVDNNPQVVSLAQDNASLNQLEHVVFKQSNWFSCLEKQQYELIVSNPPYIENNNHYLLQGDVRFEPSSALTSGDDGLDDIRKIICQSREHLTDNGWLLIEHGYQQSTQVAEILKAQCFKQIRHEVDLNGLPRVTIGRK